MLIVYVVEKVLLWLSGVSEFVLVVSMGKLSD